MIYEGKYKNKEFTVLVPAVYESLDDKFAYLTSCTWGRARDFFYKFVTPILPDLKEHLSVHNTAIIKFTYHSKKCKPVIYPDGDQS